MWLEKPDLICRSLVTSATLIQEWILDSFQTFFFLKNWIGKLNNCCIGNRNDLCQLVGKCVQRLNVLIRPFDTSGDFSFYLVPLFLVSAPLNMVGLLPFKCMSLNLKDDVSGVRGYRLNRMQACLSNGTQVKVSSACSTEAHVSPAMVYTTYLRGVRHFS